MSQYNITLFSLFFSTLPGIGDCSSAVFQENISYFDGSKLSFTVHQNYFVAHDLQAPEWINVEQNLCFNKS